MMAASTEPRSAPRAPGLLQSLAFILAATALSFALWYLPRPLTANTQWSPLPGLLSAAATLTVALLWFRYRVAPACPPGQWSLLQWPRGSVGPLLWRAALLLPLTLLGSKTLPPHLLTPTAIGLQVLLYSLVGFAEEALMRPALHLPLLLRYPGTVRIGPLRLTAANLSTAFVFGLMHLQRMVVSGPTALEIGNTIWAMLFGLLFGSYYERTRNYLGVAILHSAVDLAAFAVSLGLLR